QINTIVTVQSGQPIQMRAPSGVSQTAGFSGFISDERADCIKPAQSITQTVNQWFDPSAFAVPAAYIFGSRSTSPGPRTPGVANVDFSLFKDFPIREDKRIQF